MNKQEIKAKLKLPQRILVTGGMPNGNKPLHIGHIGAIFVWADVYARFMRDVLGKENVLFVSGTDGFGSSTEEKHRKLVESGEIDVDIETYVRNYHNIQAETLKKYDISIDLFSASCLGDSYTNHKQTSKEIFETMYAKKAMVKKSTNQFYDTKLHVVLNGRQVEGKCPIENCASEVAYADECSLGHQYTPNELIDPISVLSGTKPELRKISNFYFDLEKFREHIKAHVRNLEDNPAIRKFMIRDMKDYLLTPVSYVSQDLYEKEKGFLDALSFDSLQFDEKRKQAVFRFSSVKQRDDFCEELNKHSIRFKNNKTLAPLRISGNAKWGVELPNVDGESSDLTFYVWPESLWAPISFTREYLKLHNSSTTWEDWWKSKDAKVVQFIGEDNVYFYALAQTGIFLSQQDEIDLHQRDGQLNLTDVIANKHLLIGNVKASSSGKTKAPTADNLLDYYTVDQLRTHFISQNINTMAVNFKSKAFNPEDFQNCGDPVVAQGNTLTNVFNRIIRSVFYTLQKFYDGKIPNTKTQQWILDLSNQTLEEFVDKFRTIKFNEIMPLLDAYFKKVNLNWSEKSKIDDDAVRSQLIVDSIHAIKTGILMLHSITPKSCELVKDHLNADDDIFNWDLSDKTFAEVYPNIQKFKEIPPKFDFFKKHESQLTEKG